MSAFASLVARRGRTATYRWCNFCLAHQRQNEFERYYSSSGTTTTTTTTIQTTKILATLLEDAIADSNRKETEQEMIPSSSQEDNQKIVDRTRGKAGKGAPRFGKTAGREDGEVRMAGTAGNGGDVVLKAVGQRGPKSLGHVGNLLRAENGGNGGKERMQGKRGKTKVMEVPVGTVVWEEEEREDVVVDDNVEVTKKMMANWGSSEPRDGDNLERSDDGEHDDDELEIEYIRTAHLRPRGYKYGIWRVLADLSTHEDEFKLAIGGRGGKGNANFPVGKTAGEYDPGEPGTERRVVLELKTVADVGFIGFPNAGKSTMLTALTNAKPKIAPYAFTTLTPQFGAREIDLDKEMETKVSLTFADVPGLLPGAHRNRGLGHDFLRHVERCRVHAYIVDATGGDGKNKRATTGNTEQDDANESLPENSKETNKLPHEALIDLVNELETYKPDITKTTPAIVVVNKMDLLLFNSSEDDGNNAREGASFAEAIKKTISASITKAIGSLGKDASLWEIVFASGKTGENVDEVLEAASRAWKRMNSSASRSNYISGSDDESESDAAKAESVWSDPNRF
ncbi:unnamed protein product [Bathycoccus prasinos]